PAGSACYRPAQRDGTLSLPETADAACVRRVFERDDWHAERTVRAPGMRQPLIYHLGVDAEAGRRVDVAQEPAVAVALAGVGPQPHLLTDELSRARRRL